ncbi:sensor domain-containing diguanylate cyclase [Actinoplanes sp. NBRC 103695]|uniref:sensor domain-containing diguanylate cyclase n=1 Tax=Actinoplanes sp. NBRC 103695 TaxID=3032202 RepID=UPI0024A275C8|nr:sensor domain-containing diguanylate cyclase [Actinoplanes sp. NBRC 103695]GLZ02423.1 hypothetical protein Acsp02_96740 [Actinoplanes sp. NBRC 103695]
MTYEGVGSPPPGRSRETANRRGQPWLDVAPHTRLSDEAFRVRHRTLRIILWLQFPVLATVTFIVNDPADPRVVEPDEAGPGQEGMVVVWLMLAAMLACAIGSLLTASRQLSAAVISMGLLLSCSALVLIGNGETILHFSFFVVIGLISLYQNWLPLLISVLLVAAEYLLIGALAPGRIFADERAQASPILYAAVHVGFILFTCAVQVAYWRFIQHAQQETDDIRLQADWTVRRNAERYEALVHDSSDVISVVDRRGGITSMSAAAQRIMGYRPDDLVGTEYSSLVHPSDLGQLISEGSESAPDHRAELRIRHADGSWHWHELTVRDLTSHPAVNGRVISHRDITERMTYQQMLVHDASHDALTGLRNRAAILRAIDHELTARQSLVAVLYLDLDGFKKVNDTFGHDAGDAMLVAVADRLRRSVEGSGEVGRLGGDEFAAVLPRVTCLEDAVEVAQRVLADLAEPMTVGGDAFHPVASVGVALGRTGRTKTDELLSRADAAMYRAKRDGKGCWRVDDTSIGMVSGSR